MSKFANGADDLMVNRCSDSDAGVCRAYGGSVVCSRHF